MECDCATNNDIVCKRGRTSGAVQLDQFGDCLDTAGSIGPITIEARPSRDLGITRRRGFERSFVPDVARYRKGSVNDIMIRPNAVNRHRFYLIFRVCVDKYVYDKLPNLLTALC